MCVNVREADEARDDIRDMRLNHQHESLHDEDATLG
jgi:hypothetical protein